MYFVDGPWAGSKHEVPEDKQLVEVFTLDWPKTLEAQLNTEVGIPTVTHLYARTEVMLYVGIVES